MHYFVLNPTKVNTCDCNLLVHQTFYTTLEISHKTCKLSSLLWHAGISLNCFSRHTHEFPACYLSTHFETLHIYSSQVSSGPFYVVPCRLKYTALIIFDNSLMTNLQGDMKNSSKDYNYSVFVFPVRDGEQGCSSSHVGSLWDLFLHGAGKGYM